MSRDSARRRRLRAGLCAVALVVAGACGGDDGDGREAVGAGLDIASIPSPGDSPTAVAVDQGTVLLGGQKTIDAEARTFEVLRDVTLIGADGSASALPPIPGEAPVFITGAAHQAGIVTVAGVRCELGQDVSDTGRVNCRPGSVALVSLDLAAETWMEVQPPESLEIYDGEVRGLSLVPFGDHLLLTGSGRDNRPIRWVSEGPEWNEIAEVNGEVCAVGDSLIAIDAPILEDRPESGAYFGGERPTAPQTFAARLFNPASRSWSDPIVSPPVIAVAGSVVGGCTPSGSLHALIIAQQGGALVSYAPETGFSTVEDEGWASLMSVVPTTESSVVVMGLGGLAVVVDQQKDGLDVRRLEDLPEGLPVGNGSDRLLTVAADGQRTITPLA